MNAQPELDYGALCIDTNVFRELAYVFDKGRLAQLDPFAGSPSVLLSPSSVAQLWGKIMPVNKDLMKRNVGAHVLLQPQALRLDGNGFVRKSQVYAGEADVWVIEDVSEAGVRISHPSGHLKVLGYDHIQKYTSNGESGGTKRGFLTLHVQLFIVGNEVRVVPNARPGESVVPQPPEVVDKVVEFTYPQMCGLQARLEAQGWRIWWSRPERVSTYIDIEGAQLVLEPDEQGVLNRFLTRDSGVLLKRRI